MQRRKPGQSAIVTQRKEEDKVEFLSGIFNGVTTGTPISFTIANTNAKSKDYSHLKNTYRPSHADYTYWVKYGIRDYRGGGRSSARETAARVAAGGVARAALEMLAPGLSIRGCMVQMGPRLIDRTRWDWEEVERNPFWAPDPKAADDWAGWLDELRRDGNSVGAVIELVASGMPVVLGAPIYGQLDADLAAALMSINAVKGVETGDGFAAAALTGVENADEIRWHETSEGEGGQPHFLSNHAGGVLGGISSGQDLVARFAVKPTSSILTPRRTIDQQGKIGRAHV